MRIAAAGDLHIGRRHEGVYRHVNRPEVTCRVLLDTLRIAEVYDCSVVVLNGDVLDKAVPDPDVLLMVYRHLQVFRQRGKVVYWVRGNHEVDTYSRLDKNLMYLFQDVCRVVTDPESFTSDTSIVMMIPWYPNPDLMKQLYEDAAMLVRNDRRHRLLFTHVGLAEGRPSASNFQPPQPISVRDLHPSVWNMVLCSDYHAQQDLAENVSYMGAPIPHQFGDERWGGVWVCDTDQNEYAMVDLLSDPDDLFQGLPPFRQSPRYPRFMRWSGADLADFMAIDPEDYNELYVPQHRVEAIQARFPTARVLPQDMGQPRGGEVVIESVRLKAEDTTSAEALVDAWMRYKGLTDPGLRKIGITLLEGATRA